MEASNAEKARLEQEAALRKQQEEASRKEAEERERREAEARLKNNDEITVSKPATRLNEYFQAIASSPNVTSANNSINEALSMFSSPEAPVLIVISEYDGKKDYDRPTTIGKYLNYLKDQKKNINAISDLKTDASGKITELELRKN
ncbi:MAG TPA: nucleoid-structuring protein H-NS [Cyclobacteriaceae bacterium]|nr:nucleoid-structuring protein H-NS [Cyclobacteriaceae bacterium]